jgi:hypothetical protein
MTFRLSIRIRRKDNFEFMGEYDSLDGARDMAINAVEYLGHYESAVFNSKGVEVFNSRKEGVFSQRTRLRMRKPPTAKG